MGKNKILEDKANKDFLAKLFPEGVMPTSFVHLVLKDSELDDEDDVLKKLPADLAEFIRNMPDIHVTADEVRDVKADEFKEMQDKFEADLAKLEADNNLLQSKVDQQAKVSAFLRTQMEEERRLRQLAD